MSLPHHFAQGHATARKNTSAEMTAKARRAGFALTFIGPVFGELWGVACDCGWHTDLFTDPNCQALIKDVNGHLRGCPVHREAQKGSSAP